MPKGPKGEKRKADVSGNAVLVMKIATGEVDDAVPDDANRTQMELCPAPCRGFSKLFVPAPFRRDGTKVSS